MSDARADILSAVRRSLGVTGSERTRASGVAERLERTPRGVVPRRGQLEGEALLELFVREARAALATVAVVESAADVPGEVARHLRDNNWPATLRMGEDLRLAAMPWQDTALAITKGASAGADLNGVSHAVGAIAETGTLVLTSGRENPTTLNFLPDNHVVVVNARDVVGDLETVWSRLRARAGKGAMPRAVNLVTGPSRSGDIEQTLLLGAHGPRSLHVVVVAE